MRFTLQTLLLTFVFVWSSMALYGAGLGIIAAAFLLVMIAYVRTAVSRRDAIVRLLIAITLIGCAGLLILPSFEAAREAARRMQCRNNLKQFGIALLLYHKDHHCFPPAQIVDANGQPMHSWRTLLLPYLEGQAVYDQYDFAAPWNGLKNQALCRATQLLVFLCPSDGSSWNAEETSYVAVAGPNTAWPGTACTRLKDFKDGVSKTILLVEIADSKIPWEEPRDLTQKDALKGINPGSKPGISSYHALEPKVFYDKQPGAHALFADGSVHFLPQQITQDDLKALLTRDGGESLDPADLEDRYPPRFRWDRVAALAVFVLTFLLLAFRPRTAKSAV